MSENSETQTTSGAARKKTVVLCALILLLAAGVVWIIFSTEPVAQRETAVRQSAMLVDVVTVERGTYRPRVVETGTVAPARTVHLAPQVGGRITELHPDFDPGGFVEAGGVLARIERADYENRLEQRRAERLQAETQLQLEMGRQRTARLDFELIGESLPEGDNSLVLREPQLAAAKVEVDAARTAVEQAELDLERTAVRAPFDAQVLERGADLGSQVAAGEPIARLVGTRHYWVMATVAPSKIPFLEFPAGDDDRGAPVELHKRGAGTGVREGRLYRLVGELEPRTRLARVVIEVEDPLALEPGSQGLVPLLVGEFLEVRITGRPIADVVRLPREFLRKNDTAWVMAEDGTLSIRSLDIVFRDAAHAYVRNGLEAGERVVTSNLATVTEGAALRTEDAAPPTEDAE